MCRWVGYVGSPIEPRELLYDPERSLIEQSRRHALAMPVPNGDGFGLGWYGRSACTPRATPAARRSTRCTTAQTWTHCDSCIRPRSGSH